MTDWRDEWPAGTRFEIDTVHGRSVGVVIGPHDTYGLNAEHSFGVATWSEYAMATATRFDMARMVAVALALD